MPSPAPRALRHKAWACFGVLALMYLAFIVVPQGRAVDLALRATLRLSGNASARWVLSEALALLSIVGAIAALVVLTRSAYRRGWRDLTIVLGGPVISVALSELLKLCLPQTVGRHWQLWLPHGSFVSGHTAAATALALAVVYSWPELRPGTKLLVWAVPVCVGLATVVTGWHRPCDTVGGAALAFGVHYALRAAISSAAHGSAAHSGKGSAHRPARPRVEA